MGGGRKFVKVDLSRCAVLDNRNVCYPYPKKWGLGVLHQKILKIEMLFDALFYQKCSEIRTLLDSEQAEYAVNWFP